MGGANQATHQAVVSKGLKEFVDGLELHVSALRTAIVWPKLTRDENDCGEERGRVRPVAHSPIALVNLAIVVKHREIEI